MPILPIDQLVFKGTHNSYSCKAEGVLIGDLDPPWMNHPLNKQIDDFGVWSVQLDFSVARVNGEPKAIVGHDRPGHGACWGYFLTDYLKMIRNTQAIKYRPIFIGFDIKDWISIGFAGIDDEFTREEKYAFGLAAINEVFPGDLFDLGKFIEQNYRYPTVPEIAGKIIVDPPLRADLDFDGDECISKENVETAVRRGVRVFQIDQYQADWTFEYGIPPNPLVVDSTTQPPWTVLDSGGEEWECDNGDVWKGQVVHEQGSFRFPYTRISKAIARAKGQISSVSPNLERDRLRSGYGWTMLVKPGNYPEKITVDIPLTLKKDDRYPGTVVIGR